MALLSAQSLAGPGYIILNIIRALNIITLLAIVAASLVQIYKTTTESSFFFFDASGHVFVIITSMFLFVSECSLFRGYFSRHWPLLSASHGFVTLGGILVVLGVNMLGNLNKPTNSQAKIGMSFWQLIMASGCLGIIIGFFNIIASFIFRDTSRHITARRVRSHGAISLTTASLSDMDNPKALSITSHHTGSSSSRSGTIPQSTFGQAPTSSPQKSSRFSFSMSQFSPARTLRQARQSILPSYHSRDAAPTRSSSMYSRFTSGEPKKGGKGRKNRRDSSPEVPRLPLNISAPLNVNPQFAHLVRPDLAHHPSQRHGEAI